MPKSTKAERVTANAAAITSTTFVLSPEEMETLNGYAAKHGALRVLDGAWITGDLSEPIFDDVPGATERAVAHARKAEAEATARADGDGEGIDEVPLDTIIAEFHSLPLPSADEREAELVQAEAALVEAEEEVAREEAEAEAAEASLRKRERALFERERRVVAAEKSLADGKYDTPAVRAVLA